MYDHKVVEKKWIDFWTKNKTFEKSVDLRPKEKQFVFYDGPPFATGLPHYGHILGLTSKDAFPRFWTMKGFRCERKWGWDCHGLPVEKIAEKELGIKEKKDIKEMGVAKFNDACRSQVLSFVAEWRKTVTRMGKWIDFDNSYKTMDNSYMESVWHLLKKLYDNKYLYEGKKVLLYCPQCETPLANAEIAMDNSYRDVTEKTATVKFKVKNEENTFILAWTTTAWTVIGNVALAINPELMYAKIKVNNEFLILAKDRIKEVIKDEHEVVDSFKGETLLHKEYEPLYHQPSEKKGHYVISGGSEVSAEEGTGVVHMAMYGEFDYEMIKKYDLPIVQHVGAHGKLELGPEEWKGLWFKKADKKVLENLEERKLLFASESYTHSYPFCYRCDTPLFYHALDSWFIDIQRVKSKLLEKNKQINWHPAHLKEGRFQHILETAPDWNVSRNRFWATALPIWKCSKETCNRIEVIGSIKELQEKAVEKVPADVDLHKHIVDDIHLTCSLCSGSMDRIPEVLDCWFESGSMPYAAKHYPFENKEWFTHNYPADFISEYVAQSRTWFYYMHTLGVLVFDQAPFKNVVVTGTLLASDGSKMSKSKKNFPDPHEVFDKYGADALRFYLMASPLMKAQDVSFNEETLKEVYRKVVLLLTNVKQFYALFGKENCEVFDDSSNNVLDKWMVSRVNSLISGVTNTMEAYDTTTTCSLLQSFIEELSTWFVRRSRDRFKSSDKKVKNQAVQTLAYALYNLAKLMAPITPFVTEEVFSLFNKNKKLPESIHLDAWPIFDESKQSRQVEEHMTKTRELVSKVLELREKVKVPIRQPLAKVTLVGYSLPEEFSAILADEVNVKSVKIKKGDADILLDTTLTPELEAEGACRELCRNIQALRKKAGLQPKNVISLKIVAGQDLSKFADDIKSKVGAKDLKLLKADDSVGSVEHTTEETIKGKKFSIGFDVVK